MKFLGGFEKTAGPKLKRELKAAGEVADKLHKPLTGLAASHYLYSRIREKTGAQKHVPRAKESAAAQSVKKSVSEGLAPYENPQPKSIWNTDNEGT